jgi:hypothetical protein
MVIFGEYIRSLVYKSYQTARNIFLKTAHFISMNDIFAPIFYCEARTKGKVD